MSDTINPRAKEKHPRSLVSIVVPSPEQLDLHRLDSWSLDSVWGWKKWTLSSIFSVRRPGVSPTLIWHVSTFPSPRFNRRSASSPICYASVISTICDADERIAVMLLYDGF